MSYLTIARISGDPDTLVDGYRQSSATMTDVGRDHNLILHVAAPTDDGLLIVNLCRVLHQRPGASGAPVGSTSVPTSSHAMFDTRAVAGT